MKKNKQNRQNPFPGLRPFEREESNLYFGRDRDINIFGSEILSRRLSILHGKTGSGKTSFFEAGVGPKKLEPYDFQSYRILIKEDPFASIEHSIFGNGETEEDVPTGENDFKPGTYFQNLYSKVAKYKELKLVLFFDQFEDLFTTGISDKIRKPFVNELASAVYQSDLQIKIVIGIRNDFLFELETFRTEIPDIFKTTYYLQDLSSDDAKEAILRPASQHDLTFEETLIDALMKDLVNVNNQISAPALQIICKKLVDSCGSSTIKLEDYQDKLGGKQKILNSFIEETFAKKVIGSNKKTVITILEQLHFQGQTKYPRPLDHFEEITNLLKPKLSPILDYMESRNILTKDTREGTDWYELKHDYLIQPIDQWITKYRKRQRFRNRFILYFLLTLLILSLLFSISIFTSTGRKFWRISTAEIEAEMHLSQAEIFLNAGDFDNAADAFQKSIQETPNLRAYEGLINAYRKKNDSENTKASYETALNFIKNDTIEHKRLSIEAFTYFKERDNDRDARNFLLQHLKEFPQETINDTLKNYVLTSYFREISERSNDLRREIVKSALRSVNQSKGFEIQGLEIFNSFEYIRAVLAQSQLVNSNVSFSKLKNKFPVTEKPKIGDLIFFPGPDWPTIVGINLGMGPDPIDYNYYLCMNIRLPRVAFEMIKEDQEVEYRSIE